MGSYKNLKAGFRVRIADRDILSENEEVIDKMLRYAGMETIIKEVREWKNGEVSYILDIDPSWFWLPHSFSLVKTKRKWVQKLW